MTRVRALLGQTGNTQGSVGNFRVQQLRSGTQLLHPAVAGQYTYLGERGHVDIVLLGVVGQDEVLERNLHLQDGWARS